MYNMKRAVDAFNTTIKNRLLPSNTTNSSSENSNQTNLYSTLKNTFNFTRRKTPSLYSSSQYSPTMNIIHESSTDNNKKSSSDNNKKSSSDNNKKSSSDNNKKSSSDNNKQSSSDNNKQSSSDNNKQSSSDNNKQSSSDNNSAISSDFDPLNNNLESLSEKSQKAIDSNDVSYKPIENDKFICIMNPEFKKENGHEITLKDPQFYYRKYGQLYKFEDNKIKVDDQLQLVEPTTKGGRKTIHRKRKHRKLKNTHRKK